jgi:UDP-glucuronate decarboxylase
MVDAASGRAQVNGGSVAVSPIVRDDIKTIVNLVGPAFARLSGKSLLLTGGTGFIGSYLLETLAYVNDHVLATPCRIYVTTRDSKRVGERFPHLAARKDLILIETDVRSFRKTAEPCQFVLHAAAASDAKLFLKDPLGTTETIVDGTKAVLASIGPEVESFLFVSSGAVYGAQPADCPWLSEDHAGGPDLRDPRSCYAEAKRYAELLCRIFQQRHGVPVSVARLFTVVGPYQELNSTSAVIDFIRQALDGTTIRIRDDGEARRSYCYVTDAVTALWKLLLRPDLAETCNVGSDLEVVSFRELAHRIGRCLGKPVSVLVEGAPASGILGRRYAPDVNRLRQKTGFGPMTPLDQALSRTIDWMRERRLEGARTDLNECPAHGAP